MLTCPQKLLVLIGAVVAYRFLFTFESEFWVKKQNVLSILNPCSPVGGFYNCGFGSVQDVHTIYISLQILVVHDLPEVLSKAAVSVSWL